MNSPKLKLGGPQYIQLVSTKIISPKKIHQEEYKCYEVSQDTDEFFIHPIKF